MASRFSNVDPVTAADMRRQGLDPHELDRSTEQLMSLIHANIPDPPVSTTARLTALRARPPTAWTASAASPTRSSATLSPASPSRTPPEPLRSPRAGAGYGAPRRSSSLTPTWSPPRAPARRTSSPSSPASSPRTRGPSAASTSPAAAWARTRPSSSAGSVSSPPGASRSLSSSTARGSARCPSPRRSSPSPPSPASTSGSGSSRTWPASKAPPSPTSGSSASAASPSLSRSPAMEILNIQGRMKGACLRLVSHSLRCVQICSFVMESVDVLNALRLERLIMSECLNTAGGGSCIKGWQRPQAESIRVPGARKIRAGDPRHRHHGWD
ncbi:unnamed protein product [Triticum turgidum subsp. durum]|uniref:F-box/LRR-repeat protein 15/At3g58940/PEG3-like LRR domain-containing protein n=1 Tax=Triticum turgidum subsp. durum TaxID=4567 RepID=A0A9R0TIR3_TRITD|nr:unnamed protein product [Triticum turgidum subsp. durum]